MKINHPRHSPDQLVAGDDRGSMAQANNYASIGQFEGGVTPRGQERLCGPHSSGRPSGAQDAHGVPDNVVRLRMEVIDMISRRLPIAFRFIEERTLERLEDELDRRLSQALAGGAVILHKETK
jgi:hypothetical protein